MNLHAFYASIGALAILGAVLGFHFYPEHPEATGLQITFGDGSVWIDRK